MFKKVKQLHIEPSSFCNAACPMCTRNTSEWELNPNLKQNQLYLEDIKRIIPEEIIRELDLIYFCGNYWEPSLARDIWEIIEYFKNINNNLKIHFYTNWSTRTPDWWEKLAKNVDYCQFDIDGLEDTNHLHRIWTDWNKIISNIKSFTKAWWNAWWEYIVFKHNQHQIEEAESLSKKLWIKSFVVKKTDRFISLKDGKFLNKWKVINKLNKWSYYLEPSDNMIYINKWIEKLKQLNYQQYLNTTNIECKVLKDNSLYISADWNLFPCCRMGHIYNRWNFETEQILNTIWHLDSISLFKNNFYEILNNIFLQKKLPNSWNCHSINEWKLRVCSRICWSIDSNGNQFEESYEKWLHVPSKWVLT